MNDAMSVGGACRELASLRLLLQSNSDTRAVDAYCLAIIKVERQVRRFATVFSLASFSGPAPRDHVEQLLNEKVYFVQMVDWFDQLSARAYADLVGSADWSRFRLGLEEAKGHRDKLFHGCLTAGEGGLDRAELVSRTDLLSELIERVAREGEQWVGYSGCSNTVLVDLGRVRSRLKCDRPTFDDVTSMSKAFKARPKRRDLKLPA